MKLDEDNGYWTQDLNETNIKDLEKDLKEFGAVVPIVDGLAGGIIAYALCDHAERITKILNKHREEKEKLCQLCHKEEVTEGNYCLKCSKRAAEATEQDYIEDKVKDGKEAVKLNEGKEVE